MNFAVTGMLSGVPNPDERDYVKRSVIAKQYSEFYKSFTKAFSLL